MKRPSYKKLYKAEKARREQYERLCPEVVTRYAAQQERFKVMSDCVERAIMFGNSSMHTIVFAGIRVGIATP